MDYLWSPWRFRYVSQGIKTEGCIFCKIGTTDPSQDRKHFVLHRAPSSFVLLNLYPYTSGHTLIAPYAHVAGLADLPGDVLAEMMELARKTQAALEAYYKPEGYNLGMNLGKCAGAGVADHLHLHILPRWSGDANFMSVVGETRVLPEDLQSTYDHLVGLFKS